MLTIARIDCVYSYSHDCCAIYKSITDFRNHATPTLRLLCATDNTDSNKLITSSISIRFSNLNNRDVTVAFYNRLQLFQSILTRSQRKQIHTTICFPYAYIHTYMCLYVCVSLLRVMREKLYQQRIVQVIHSRVTHNNLS